MEGKLVGLGRALGRGVGAVAVLSLGLVGVAALSATPAQATVSLTPRIVVTNTGNGTPGSITTYPLPSTGNVPPSTTITSPTPGLYRPNDVAADSSGDLWVPDTSTGSINEYSATQLTSSGRPTPAVTISGDTHGVGSLAFDSSGNLWVLNVDSSNIWEYPKADLSSSGSPSPTTVISNSSNSIDGPERIAFDSATGDLWLTNASNDTLTDFTPTQLAAGGAQAATVTISATSGSLQVPTGITFDASGNAWVTNQNAGDVVEFGSSQLTATGSPTPQVILGSEGTSPPSIVNPYQVRFDSSGDLWVTNSNYSTLSEFTPTQLVTGTPTPTYMLQANSATPPSVDDVEGFTFVGSDLWLGNDNASDLVRFTSSQLVSGPAPTPGVIISATGTTPLDTATSVALDANGNTWVANDNGDTIEMFPPGATGVTSPSIVIGSGSCTENQCRPGGLAFDQQGDLWVANSDANQNTITEYSASQLTASGDPVPAIELTPTGISRPEQLAFDPSGDLWVANSGASEIDELTPTELASSGSPDPAVVISGLTAEPVAIAIDQSGDLWWSACSTQDLTEYSASQLEANSTNPTPAAVVVAPNGCSQQLAFDTSGDLWQSGYGDGPIGDYTPAQLAAGGSQTPTNAITGNATGLNFVAGMALGEAPGSPQSPTTAVTSGNADFTWNAPPFSIPWTTGYTVTPEVNGAPLSPVLLAASATSYELPGGTAAGSSYAFEIQATNAFGGSPTATSNTVSIPANPTPPPSGGGGTSAPPASHAAGYWEVASDGGIFNYGGAPFFGSAGGLHLNKPVVGIAATPDHGGYWEVASDGGIFNYGDAVFHGSTGSLHLNAPIVGIASTPDGGGYWEVASDGGVFAFGDATFYGSAAAYHVAKPVVGIASTKDGHGYWEVASDGGVFAFGDAVYDGSAAALHINKPVVGVATTPDGGGYWEVAADGGVFSYGDAQFFGSNGATPPTPDIQGIAVSADGGGYLEAGASGAVYGYGDFMPAGSVSQLALNAPIVGIALG